MFNLENPVAILVKDQYEKDLFETCLSKFGMNNFKSFFSAKKAYEVATKEQFNFFITRIEMKDMNGLTFIQKIRAAENYGSETHLIVSDLINTPKLNVLIEHDLPYVIVPNIHTKTDKTYLYIPPLEEKEVTEKIKHIIDNEENISEIEQKYRNAKISLKNNMYDMCHSFLEDIINKRPHFEKALILRGDLAVKKENYDGATSDYEKVIELNTKSPVAKYKLSLCHIAQGFYEKAAINFNQLADTNTYNIKLLEGAGLSNYKIEHFDKAEKHIENLLKIDDTNMLATTLQVEIKVKRGDYSNLSKLLSTSHNVQESIQCLNKIGTELAKENKYLDAIKIYQSCIKDFPTDKNLNLIYYNLGLVYSRLNDNELARNCFKTSVTLDPTFEKAQKALKKYA